MPTKLGRFAEGLIEAAWLAALVLVPIFFNIYSSRIFEPDKITLLRSITLVLLAAWLVKLYEERGFRRDRFLKEDAGFGSMMKIPLILPVTALAIVYLISTIFSVTPYTSLWGSYQRLQGTYTTFSYLIIFFSLIANLRRREQIERLITVAILSSLPVSLYGVLQRFQVDPIPWGGDTTQRIAANLGNSIFVAAYLIMVFPLALMRAVEAFEAMLVDRGRLWPNFARATGYSFTLSLQIIAIYYSGSRGPWLGLGASLIVIWLTLSLVWRKRWLTITGVALAFLAGGFLVLLNVPGGPLESLRNRPEFGRLGQLLDAESRTGRVRSLIWKGAADLMTPHPPLEYPDGKKDAFNILRPLIGYGPESMYVTYNRFYPPELTEVEKRNASPDRSHNETWDSLVITGVFGLVIYLFLFGSLLYFGMKWLGLVPSNKERRIFLGLYISGGVLSSIGFVTYGGKGFLGVALPFGMVAGAILYMIIISLLGKVDTKGKVDDRFRSYLMISLLAAITAHFVEINFGIAIAATRVYFWVFSGLMLLLGYILPLHTAIPQPADETTNQTEIASAALEKPGVRKTSSKTSRRKSAGVRSLRQTTSQIFQPWIRHALIIGVITALLLVTLGYEFISNPSKEADALSLMWASLTKPAHEGSRNGVLPLMVTAWLISLVVLASETVHTADDSSLKEMDVWLKIIGFSLLVSFILALIFLLWNSASLSAFTRETAQNLDDVLKQVRDSEQILTRFYFQVFLLLSALAVFLPLDWPTARSREKVFSYILGLGLLFISFGFSAYSNLRVIQADIAFKTGDLFARPDTWPAAIAIYNRANRLSPNEDYYYLFLGRAYLEYAKTLDNSTDRDKLIEQAARDLRKAQEINPLNTDHTANLARLYSLWANYAENVDIQRERSLKSAEYFEKALSLSPNNSRLWDESAVVYLHNLVQPEQAFARLQRALELDPNYDWTYGLLGEYYSQIEASQYPDQPEKKGQLLSTAADYYAKALKLGEGSASSQLTYNYAIALGGIFSQLDQVDQAVWAYEKALRLSPESVELWKIQATLAQLYFRLGNSSAALQAAESALASAPDNQKDMISEIINRISGQQK